MKKLLAVLLYFLAVAASRESGMTVNPPLTLTSQDDILKQVRSDYDSALGEFKHAALELASCFNSYPKSPRAHCADGYRALRDAYKRVEPLLEYRDEESVRMFFNGAPLKSVEPHVPEVVVIEPEGMQVLDELMYLGDGEGNVEELSIMTETLMDRIETLIVTQRISPVFHHHVWNGIRLTLIRLYNLGLTGFDTPGSAMAIEDALVTLDVMQGYVELYRPLIEEAVPGGYHSLKALLVRGSGKLEASSFEELDRLDFLMEVIDPLFEKLLDIQQAIGIELPDETTDDIPAINFTARSLFAPQLFNMDYYTNMVWSDVSQEKIELGRVLFFDPVLSDDLSMSCASCHDPQKAFTDGLPKSNSGKVGMSVSRNAPTLIDCVISERFFLDMREEQIERQIKHVVLDSLEFNTDFQEIVGRLSGSSTYREMFAEVYPENRYQLSKWSVSDALAAYVASLTSFDSPVDKYIRGDLAKLDASVYNGFNLFMGKAACGSCHFAPAFNGTLPPVYQHTESEVLGVPVMYDTANATVDPDLGRYSSKRPTDEAEIYVHSFKTTTVRNVALTAPYMHNGVFETLEQVVDFYNRGGGAGIGIDLPHQTLPDSPLDLSQHEIRDIVAFMESLTDTTGLTVMPLVLPEFDGQPDWNDRAVGGTTSY